MKYVALNKVDNNIILKGDGCVTTIGELYTVLVDKSTTEIELTKEFIDANFTYNALCNFVSQASSLAPNVRIWSGGVLYDTTYDAIKELRSFKEPSEFLYAMEHNPTKLIALLQKLCDNYIESFDEANLANNKIATMLVTIDDLHKRIDELNKVNKNVTEAYNDTVAKLQALVSRINFKYEKNINTDESFILSENKYSSILYVKELSRVHYTDSLLYYLRQIINTLYGMPCRFVVIEPYYSYGCEERYPELVPHWELSYKDVQSGDILMAGFQPKLMKDILHNASHVNYLVVLDRGGYRHPHIKNSNVRTIYTISDTKDLPTHITSSQVISYSPKTMYIPYINNFEELSPESRITKYSSMDVTKHLINILEEV